MVSKALKGEKLPVYGTGENVRDWIHVHDHNVGVDLIVRNGKVGEVYTSARIGKFIFATASTNSVDCVAQFFSHGYKVVDVIDLNKLLGDASYITCCKYGLLMGRK